MFFFFKSTPLWAQPFPTFLSAFLPVCVSSRARPSLNHPSSYLKGSVSWTSSAAPRILPSFSAWARAFSSTRPPRAVLTRNAPWRICSPHKAASEAQLEPDLTVSLANGCFDGHVDAFDPQQWGVKYDSIVVGDGAGSTWEKKRCGAENSLKPKPGDEMKAEAMPPPLAAQKKRHGKKKV